MRAGQVLALLFSLGGLAIAPVWAADAGLTVKTLKISEKKAGYEIAFSYPHTGVRAIDDEIEPWVRGLAKEFVESAADAEPDRPWSGELRYDVTRNDGAMFGVMFTYYSYTGGAHPNSHFEAFNFLRPDGVHVEIADLFTRRGIERISAMSIAALRRELDGPDSMTDNDWIARGAGPNAGNFAAFALLADELAITFDAYQVAAYAAGPQEVHLPLAKLKDVMRPDPRAPAPSFDCAKAKTDVEQAICSNRELARADRHVAEAYAAKLAWEESAGREAVRVRQREWLKRRDEACRAAGQPLVACLMGVYQKRLRELDGSP